MMWTVWMDSSFTDNDTEEDEFISTQIQQAADAWMSVLII